MKPLSYIFRKCGFLFLVSLMRTNSLQNTIPPETCEHLNPGTGGLRLYKKIHIQVRLKIEVKTFPNAVSTQIDAMLNIIHSEYLRNYNQMQVRKDINEQLM